MTILQPIAAALPIPHCCRPALERDGTQWQNIRTFRPNTEEDQTGSTQTTWSGRMLPILLADVVVQSSEIRGFAVGWGTLSLINAGLAQSKNHSGLLWWLISLFLGPVATFLIVALLEKKPGPMP